jgi:hypothetical protein
MIATPHTSKFGHKNVAFKRYYLKSAPLLPKFRLHTLIHTFAFETQLQYFVLDSLVAEV